MKKILMILYRDLDFDGRAARMVEVVNPLGALTVLDATWKPLPDNAPKWRKRVVLGANWGKAKRHLVCLWRTIVEARRLKPDIIVAENFFSTFTGWLAARLTGVPVVYDSYELMLTLPQEPAPFQFRFWGGLERLMAPHMDLVLAANPERAAEMQKAYGLKICPDPCATSPRARS
jgi:hypothetical protein